MEDIKPSAKKWMGISVLHSANKGIEKPTTGTNRNITNTFAAGWEFGEQQFKQPLWKTDVHDDIMH